MTESPDSSPVPVTSNHITNKIKFSRKTVIIFITAFAIIGGLLLWRSFAASSVVAFVEAEKIVELPKGAKIVKLQNASSGQALQFTNNGTATASLTLPSSATSASVRVYGNVYGRGCQGRPQISMTIDDKVVVPSTEVNTTWTDFSGDVALAKGTHTIKITGSKLGWERSKRCTRLFSVDVIKVMGSPSVVSAPTLAFSASPSTVIAGSSSRLTWASTNTTSCTASGGWSGTKATSGTMDTGALSANTSYNLSCKGEDGSTVTANPVSVTVTQQTSTPPSTSANCKGTGTGWNGLGGNSYPGSWLSADCPPYASNSPFNMLVTNPAIHPQSKDIVANVLSNGIGNLSTGVAAGKDYAHPIYYAQTTDPLVTVDVGGYSLTGMKIRIPANAQPAVSSDGHISIVQPDGWEYDFWKASRPNATTLKAQIGYRQKYDGLGIVTPAMTNSDKTVGGTTAPYFGLHTGIIRGPELVAGKINHALFLVISCGSANTSFGEGAKAPGASGRGGAGSFVYPAFKGDAACSGTRPPMGARFWLDRTSTQIDATPGLAGWEKTIAKAMNQYGGYMGDTGGPGFGFQFESSTMYTSLGAPNPFETVAKANGLKKDPTYGYTFRPSTAMQTMFKDYLRVITPPSQ